MMANILTISSAGKVSIAGRINQNTREISQEDCALELENGNLLKTSIKCMKGNTISVRKMDTGSTNGRMG